MESVESEWQQHCQLTLNTHILCCIITNTSTSTSISFSLHSPSLTSQQCNSLWRPTLSRHPHHSLLTLFSGHPSPASPSSSPPPTSQPFFHPPTPGLSPSSPLPRKPSPSSRETPPSKASSPSPKMTTVTPLLKSLFNSPIHSSINDK